MMMSDLPVDLVEEILSRIPTTTLRKLRSTCKRWNTLFRDGRFAEKHFRRAKKESMVLMLKEYRVCPMSVNLNVSPPSIEFKGALDLKYDLSSSKQVDIAEVFHCDGLLLCTTKDYRLVVWNPCLGETRRIQLKTDNENIHSYTKFALGYQNNKSCRSYKILRFWCCYEPNYHSVTEFEIYEFNSNSWRVLNDVIHLKSSVDLRYGGVSLKGNTYWLAYDCNSESNSVLLGFDFTTERFIKNLCLPPSQNPGITALSVVREEQLSVLKRNDSTLDLEIWVTNKIDTEVALLWSKSFTVDLHTRPSCLHRVFSSLLVDEEKKVALCCNVDIITSGNMVYTIGEDKEYFTQVPYKESENIPLSENKIWWPFIFNYVPSLVQIQ